MPISVRHDLAGVERRPGRWLLIGVAGRAGRHLRQFHERGRLSLPRRMSLSRPGSHCPACGHADSLVRQRAGPRLAAAWRALPRLRRHDFAPLSAGRGAGGRDRGAVGLAKRPAVACPTSIEGAASFRSISCRFAFSPAADVHAHLRRLDGVRRPRAAAAADWAAVWSWACWRWLFWPSLLAGRGMDRARRSLGGTERNAGWRSCHWRRAVAVRLAGPAVGSGSRTRHLPRLGELVLVGAFLGDRAVCRQSAWSA